MAKRREVRRSGVARRIDAVAATATDPLVALATFVADLAYALLERRTVEIRQLLRDPLSARLPREVRAEAMQFSRLPDTSARAPIHTLRFAHRLHELQAGAGDNEGPLGQLDLFAEKDEPPW